MSGTPLFGRRRLLQMVGGAGMAGAAPVGQLHG